MDLLTFVSGQVPDELQGVVAIQVCAIAFHSLQHLRSLMRTKHS